MPNTIHNITLTHDDGTTSQFSIKGYFKSHEGPICILGVESKTTSLRLNRVITLDTLNKTWSYHPTLNGKNQKAGDTLVNHVENGVRLYSFVALQDPDVLASYDATQLEQVMPRFEYRQLRYRIVGWHEYQVENGSVWFSKKQDAIPWDRAEIPLNLIWGCNYSEGVIQVNVWGGAKLKSLSNYTDKTLLLDDKEGLLLFIDPVVIPSGKNLVHAISVQGDQFQPFSPGGRHRSTWDLFMPLQHALAGLVGSTSRFDWLTLEGGYKTRKVEATILSAKELRDLLERDTYYSGIDEVTYTERQKFPVLRNFFGQRVEAGRPLDDAEIYTRARANLDKPTMLAWTASHIQTCEKRLEELKAAYNAIAFHMPQKQQREGLRTVKSVHIDWTTGDTTVTFSHGNIRRETIFACHIDMNPKEVERRKDLVSARLRPHGIFTGSDFEYTEIIPDNTKKSK